MSAKELYGKLTPGHFAQGGNFNRDEFAALVAALQERAGKIWLFLVIWIVVLGFGLLLGPVVGGAVGYGASVLCIIVAPLLAMLPTMGVSRQIKSAYKNLGINQRDVDEAIGRVKAGDPGNMQGQPPASRESGAFSQAVKQAIQPVALPPDNYAAIGWFFKALRHYADFSGRARRKEYWMFVLFNVIFSIVWQVLFTLLFELVKTGWSDMQAAQTIASLSYFAVFLLPGMAVAVRRLHDLGKSGWWLFIGLVPLVGAIWLFVLMVMGGEPRENRYGPDPMKSSGVFDEPAKLKSAGITLTVAGTAALMAAVIYVFLASSVGGSTFTGSATPVLINLALLIAGVLLLGEQRIHEMRGKGTAAIALLLVAFAILIMSDIFRVPITLRLMGTHEWKAGMNLLIMAAFHLLTVLFVACVLFFKRNQGLVRGMAVLTIAVAALYLLWSVSSRMGVDIVFDVEARAGLVLPALLRSLFGTIGGSLVPLSMIVLAGTFLSAKQDKLRNPR